MSTYTNDWLGLDRGHEGAWNPSIWAGVIQAVYDCGGTVDFSDFSSLFYQKLSSRFPTVSWASKDRNGAARSFFRDAREPWTSTHTLKFGEREISITRVGLSIIDDSCSYGDVLVEAFKQYKESNSEDNPFAIICSCLLLLPVGAALSLDDISKIMRHYRPENGDNFAEVLAAENEKIGAVTERRIKSILTLLSYAGAILNLGKEYFIASRMVAEEIINKPSKDKSKRKRALFIDRLYQLIIYGAPGTGKSWRINRDTEGCEVIRTTFHPDSDYSTFVGAYKPSMETRMETRTFQKVEGNSSIVNNATNVFEEKQIVYKFVAQAFVKAYVNAWKALVCAVPEGEVKPQYLVIEEINRGNCAQIFGDLFQLLDRNDEGFSDYEIAADDDLRQYLADAFKDLQPTDAAERVPAEVAAKLERILRGEILLLPSNLYIWATMNTSDQSLFPIDSAFKRRWEWRYVPISDGGKGWKIRVADPENADAAHDYDWWAFLEKANDLVQKFTDSEDKKLGYYFCKANAEGVIPLAQFVGKVVFYLWNSVFKDADADDAAFKDGKGGFLRFSDFFDAKGDPNAGSVRQFLQNLEVPEIAKD